MQEKSLEELDQFIVKYNKSIDNPELFHQDNFVSTFFSGEKTKKITKTVETSPMDYLFNMFKFFAWKCDANNEDDEKYLLDLT